MIPTTDSVELSVSPGGSLFEPNRKGSLLRKPKDNDLEENGAIVLVNHRMRQDDLTGMVRAQQAAGGDKWEVAELRPDMERGLALWPSGASRPPPLSAIW
jgi:hypothetical protein